MSKDEELAPDGRSVSSQAAGRVIVCGGRDFNDREAVFKTLDYIRKKHGIKMLWHGNARGADRLADEWARSRNVACFPVPAEWKKYGKAAGPKRNQKMLGQGIDMVIAFPGGRGTADMVSRATAIGVHIWRYVQSPAACSEAEATQREGEARSQPQHPKE